MELLTPTWFALRLATVRPATDAEQAGPAEIGPRGRTLRLSIG